MLDKIDKTILAVSLIVVVFGGMCWFTWVNEQIELLRQRVGKLESKPKDKS